MKIIHICRAGVELGTFSEHEVRAGIRKGQFYLSDMGWHDAIPAWLPLSELYRGSTARAAGSTAITPIWVKVLGTVFLCLILFFLFGLGKVAVTALWYNKIPIHAQQTNWTQFNYEGLTFETPVELKASDKKSESEARLLKEKQIVKMQDFRGDVQQMTVTCAFLHYQDGVKLSIDAATDVALSTMKRLTGGKVTHTVTDISASNLPARSVSARIESDAYPLRVEMRVIKSGQKIAVVMAVFNADEKLGYLSDAKRIVESMSFR